MGAERFYQESSLLPVTEEITWNRAIFLQGATTIADHFGYEEWKKEEIVRTLENIFNSVVNAGKTFDEAVLEVEEAVQRAIHADQSAN